MLQTMAKDLPTRMLVSPSEKAGRIIRRQRLSTRVAKSGNRLPGPMSLRDLVALLAELEQLDPYLYRAYSRVTQTRIENGGADYILEKMSDPRMLNALIKILWGGNVAAFEADTGIALPALSMLRSGVPTYVEGQPRSGFVERIPPPYPCDFVLRITASDLSPMLVPGQLIGLVRPSSRADIVNQVVVVDDEGYGLRAALAHQDGSLVVGDRALARLAFRDVLGVAAWIGQRPRQAPDL